MYGGIGSIGLYGGIGSIGLYGGNGSCPSLPLIAHHFIAHHSPLPPHAPFGFPLSKKKPQYLQGSGGGEEYGRLHGEDYRRVHPLSYAQPSHTRPEEASAGYEASGRYEHEALEATGNYSGGMMTSGGMTGMLLHDLDDHRGPTPPPPPYSAGATPVAAKRVSSSLSSSLS